MSGPLLAGSGLAVAVAGSTLLAEVEIAVGRGECVGLIGPNGAGKTTLLRVLAGLADADRGEVRVAGQPLAAIPPRALARRLGYLAQGAPAHWPLAVERVVALGRLPHLAWWQRPGAEDAAAVEEALALAEVAALRQRAVNTLSGGERLRVLLARVFAARPQLILADEPVAALDPYHQLQVMELLRDHARRGGGVLAVLHDLNLAARFCDRLVLLAGGRVLCAGPPREVLDDDRLRAAYGVEVRRFEEDGELAVLPWRRAREPGGG